MRIIAKRAVQPAITAAAAGVAALGLAACESPHENDGRACAGDAHRDPHGARTHRRKEK